MGTSQLTRLEREGIQELGNIGAGQAASYLSEILDRPVDINIPEVDVVPLPQSVTETPDLFDDLQGSHIVGVYVPTTGLPGGALLSFTQEDCRQFLSAVLDSDVAQIRDQEEERLTEIGEQLADAYLDAVTQFLPVSVDHEAGRTITMPEGTMVAHIASTIYPQNDNDGTPDVLVVKSTLSIGDIAEGHMLLLLRMAKTDRLINALHERLQT